MYATHAARARRNGRGSVRRAVPGIPCLRPQLRARALIRRWRGPERCRSWRILKRLARRVYQAGWVNSTACSAAGWSRAVWRKSTLLLQSLAALAPEKRVLYVSAEESEAQIALRAQRLGLMERARELRVL